MICFVTNNHSERAMPRLMLTDEQWSKLHSIMLESGRIYNKSDHRNTVEGILYRMRVGCPWRDLPDSFGRWNTIFRRFNLWSKKGIIAILFNELSKETDTEWEFLDGSIVKAHQHCAGPASGQPEAVGRSRGGRSTKIHLAVDSYGLPIHFKLSGGEVNDSTMAGELLQALPPGDYVIADKGYDSEAIRDNVRAQGAIPVIPRRRNNKTGNADMDWCLYKYRHLVENAFARLKHFRAIATRYDKLERNYGSMIALACCVIWLPM